MLAIFPSPRASVDSLASELGAPFPILADEKGMVYDLYGVAKASLLSIYRPRALVGALKALAKGFLPRQGEGDLGRFPATFLLDKKGFISFAHRGSHSGDRVEADELISLLEKESFRGEREGGIQDV